MYEEQNRERYERLLDYFQVQPDRKGYAHVPCPWCGKEHKHFGFNKLGYRCFACGESGHLGRLIAHLRIDTGVPYTPPPRRPQPVQEAPSWLAVGPKLVEQYLRHPKRAELWQAYKPLSLATLDRHRFGVGTLPGFTTQRLIVPLYSHGALVGLAGRTLQHEEPKWLAAKGSNRPLWNVDSVRPGGVLWICENYVDAALVMQETPRYDAVALGMARGLNDAEVEQIRRIAPAKVFVAMDNDLVGQAEGQFKADLEYAWREAHPQAIPPIASGIVTVNKLLAAGVNAILFHWPAYAPPKADLGWLLTRKGKRTARSRLVHHAETKATYPTTGEQVSMDHTTKYKYIEQIALGLWATDHDVKQHSVELEANIGDDGVIGSWVAWLPMPGALSSLCGEELTVAGALRGLDAECAKYLTR